MTEPNTHISAGESNRAASSDRWKRRMRDFYLGDDAAPEEIWNEIFNRVERLFGRRPRLPSAKLEENILRWFTGVVDAVYEIREELSPITRFYALRRFMSQFQKEAFPDAAPAAARTELTAVLSDYDVDGLVLRRCAKNRRLLDVTGERSFNNWAGFYFKRHGVLNAVRAEKKTRGLEEGEEARLPDRRDFGRMFEARLDADKLYRLISDALEPVEQVYFDLSLLESGRPSASDYLEVLRAKGFSQYGSPAWVTKVGRRVKIKKYLVGLENGFSDLGLSDLIEIAEKEAEHRLEARNRREKKTSDPQDIRDDITLHMINRLWAILSGDEEGLSAYRRRFGDPEFRKEFGDKVDWRGELKRAQADGARKEVRAKILIPAYRSFRRSGTLDGFCSAVEAYSKNQFGEGIKEMFIGEPGDDQNNQSNNSGDGRVAADGSGGASKKRPGGGSCFSFQHCRQLARGTVVATEEERSHLEDCFFCLTRTQEFRRLHAERVEAARAAALTAPRPEPLPAVEIERQLTWRRRVMNTAARLYGSVSTNVAAAFSRPVAAGLAFAALVLLVGAIGFFVFRTRPNLAGLRVPDPGPGVKVSPPDAPGQTPSVTSDNPPRADSSPDAGTQKKGGAAPKEAGVPPRPAESRVESSLDLRGIPEAYHAFVKSVWNSMTVPVPEDLESLLFKLPTLRAPSAGEPKLISPNRRAIVEARPTFRWEGPKDASFRIVVRDERKKEVARGDNLTGNSWVAPDALPAGIYFWEVAVFDEGGKEIAKTRMEAIFKVVDKAEVERVKSENRSHLAKASYFINVGLLDDARRELEAELRKNPNSRKARNILRQVRKWQRQLHSS